VAGVRTVLVTGASSCFGRALVPLLCERGYRVIATDSAGQAFDAPVSGESRVGDLESPVFIEQAVAGCDAVVHAATPFDSQQSPSALARLNTDAVVRLYQAAQQAGVERFVHVSSTWLYAANAPGPLTEESPIASRDAHAGAQEGAEVFLSRQDALPWTILRVAPTYGSGGGNLSAALFAVGPLLRSVTPVLPRLSGGTVCNLVHAHDVAAAAEHALRVPAMRYQIYNVADDDALSLGERLSVTFGRYGAQLADPACIRAMAQARCRSAARFVGGQRDAPGDVATHRSAPRP
jgi:2-alkyl-3-oxoalkanoate reductase